jgi:hypothetical protein
MMGLLSIGFLIVLSSETKLPLTIRAKDRIMLSTQTALPPFKATFIGLEEGDTPESVVSVTYHCAAFPSSPAGTYDITPSGPSSTAKYEITYQNGTLKKFSAADVPRIGLQLSGSDRVRNQYTNFPSSYPVCKTGTTHVSLDQLADGTWPRADNAHNPFSTTNMVMNFGRYPSGPNFENTRFYSGDDVRFRIAYYDNRAWDVQGVFLFRETWESTMSVDPDAPWQGDKRIVSAEEMRRIHNSIGTSTLKCKNSVKFFQFLGGGTPSDLTHFPQLPDSAKTHIANCFDGVGLETHVGGYIRDPQQQDSMAEIAKWTAEQGMECLVFMGGTPNTYMSMPRTQRSYHEQWQKMHDKGVNYRSPHIIYQRQGRYNWGLHTPESQIDTLSEQQKWLIETLEPGGTSMFISPVPSPQRMLPSTEIWVAFCAGGEVSDPRPLTVSASSSNTGLIPNSGLQIIGSGADRSLRVTPVSGATGWAAITLTVTDGIRTKTTSFDVNVANDIQVLSQASGRLNDSTTWGRNVPVGDISENNEYVSTNPQQPGRRDVYWLNLRANDHAGMFIWRLQGNHTVSVHKTSFGVEDMGSTVPFFGENLDVLTAVLTSSSGEHLMLRSLTLVNSGATVRAPDIAGQSFKIRLNHGGVTLQGGTLQSGNADLADLTFENCYLAGDGTILVKGSSSHDSRVVFLKNQIWHTVGFTGKFVVQDYGKLDLPGVEVENASFGVEVSGTGKLVLRNNTALKSLKIAGAVIPPGTYTYNSFTTAQQAYLISVASWATLTVVP